MVSIISNLYSLTSNFFTFFTPDFFQMFYTGFILFSIYTATWLLSVKLNDATFSNFLWGISFAIQALIYFYKSLEFSFFSMFTEKFSWEKLTFTILIIAHGVRLSTHMLMREKGHNEDKRYKDLREKFGGNFWWMSYFAIFLPSLLVNLTMGTVIYAFANVDRSSICHFRYWSGIFSMLFGGVLGALSDLQKFQFTRNKRNEGKLMDKGFWSLCRHPNYLGEIIFWFGAFLVNFSAGIYWTIISPIVHTLHAFFITIPANEKTLKDQFGEAFNNYAKRVPMFLPFFSASSLDIKGGKGFQEDLSASGANANANLQNNRQSINQ